MPGSIQSIERAAAVVRLLAAGPARLGVGELARSLGLAKGTVHGIVRTLEQVGFLEQDRASAKYQLGAALLQLGTSYLDANELRSLALNWADALAARSGQAVRIGTLREGRVLVVHHVFRPDDTAQAVEVGALLAPHACALGKVLLAYDAGAAAAAAAGGLEALTRRTLVRPSTLAASLAALRAVGWGEEVEELTPGEAGVAAPVRHRGGLVVGAIGVSGPVERVCDGAGRPWPALVTQVREAAWAISRELAQGRR